MNPEMGGEILDVGECLVAVLAVVGVLLLGVPLPVLAQLVVRGQYQQTDLALVDGLVRHHLLGRILKLVLGVLLGDPLHAALTVAVVIVPTVLLPIVD